MHNIGDLSTDATQCIKVISFSTNSSRVLKAFCSWSNLGKSFEWESGKTILFVLKLDSISLCHPVSVLAHKPIMFLTYS